MKFYFYIFLLINFSCSSLEYRNFNKFQGHEIGTIGIFESYLLHDNHQPKTVVKISKPIRVKTETIKVTKRNLFQREDSIILKPKDSTLISFEILDKVSLLMQINEDQDLLKYLKKADHFRMVSKVKMYFPGPVLEKISDSDEIYLIQNKQSTLSLELRKDNETTGKIEFTDGEIIDFRVLDFCWGQSRRRDIEIFDLVPVGNMCSEGTYKTARKAKKKNELKF